ncbi:CD1107 family mobile element protein [Caryophanon latum]|nr:DUF4366 domain-containing protein [Caryophanon latum]
MSSLKKFLILSICMLSLSLGEIVYATPQLSLTSPPIDGDPPSGQNVKENEVIEEIDAQTPASVTGETMQGNGTVVDYTTSGSKAFYTITDTEQNTFYLIIDMDKTQNNVYFLKNVNESDLNNVPTINEGIAPTPPINMPEPEAVQEESNSGLGFTIIVLLIAALGVAAYYFLYMRKRPQHTAEENDDEEMDEHYDDRFDDELDEQNHQKKD